MKNDETSAQKRRAIENDHFGVTRATQLKTVRMGNARGGPWAATVIQI